VLSTRWMMFVPHRKYTYVPPQPVTVIDLLIFMFMIFIPQRKHVWAFTACYFLICRWCSYLTGNTPVGLNACNGAAVLFYFWSIVSVAFRNAYLIFVPLVLKSWAVNTNISLYTSIHPYSILLQQVCGNILILLSLGCYFPILFSDTAAKAKTKDSSSSHGYDSLRWEPVAECVFFLFPRFVINQ
jgi:hypothetical protein